MSLDGRDAARNDMDARARKIRFDDLPPDGGGGSASRQPGLPTAIFEEVDLDDASREAFGRADELLLIIVPLVTTMAADAQRKLEAWARARTPTGDPVIEVSLRNVRIIVSSRRALLFADEHAADATDGLVRAANIHRCLLYLEADVADRLSQRGPLYSVPNQIVTDLETALATQFGYLQLRNALERPDREATVWSTRVFQELAVAAQLSERLDAAEAPVQHFRETAEAAHQRTSDHRHFLISTIAEAAIAVLLALDLLFVVFQ